MGTSGTPLQYLTVDRLGMFFIEPDLFDNIVPFDNAAPIFLINLLWKLVLGLGFLIFTEINENEHPIFRKFRGM